MVAEDEEEQVRVTSGVALGPVSNRCSTKIVEKKVDIHT